MNNFGYFSTRKILKNIHVKRNLKKLTIAAENGNAKAMEKIGIDFFRRVLDVEFDKGENIDIFEGILLSIHWFDKAIEAGKMDSNYWIGETIELYAYCGRGGQAYYPHYFKEFIQSKKCQNIFLEIVEAKKGYLYQVLKNGGINIHDNIVFYQKATDVGDSSAAFRLGEIYLNRWYSEYYEYIKYNKPLSDSDYLSLAQKYLDYACKRGESYAISLLFKVLKIMEMN